MLILTRRSGETVHIGDDVMVTVLAIKGNQVRIGIKAPRSVAVDREEIFERKRTEGAARQSATQGAPPLTPSPSDS